MATPHWALTTMTWPGQCSTNH